jgi:hypothetical protein
MTSVATPVAGTRTPFELVTVDLYRDIHKGIRRELFAVTSEAGWIDPADDAARTALAEHVADVCTLLVAHAEHEDEHIEPVLAREHPGLAATIAEQHQVIDATLVDLEATALEAAAAPSAEQRARVHHLYLDLARFTATYLEHEEVEERIVMPALETAIGADAVLAIEQAIVGSIPPDEMARSLAVMLPAMNVEDRTELLDGIRSGAPAEAFAGIWALTQSVLDAPDVVALAGRLGL